MWIMNEPVKDWKLNGTELLKSNDTFHEENNQVRHAFEEPTDFCLALSNSVRCQNERVKFKQSTPSQSESTKNLILSINGSLDRFQGFFLCIEKKSHGEGSKSNQTKRLHSQHDLLICLQTWMKGQKRNN